MNILNVHVSRTKKYILPQKWYITRIRNFIFTRMPIIFVQPPLSHETKGKILKKKWKILNKRTDKLTGYSILPGILKSRDNPGPSNQTSENNTVYTIILT